MGHSFKPVTTGEQLQVAILDELQKISSLLEPSRDPEPAADPEPTADAPAEDKPEPKAPAKKTQRRQTKVDGR